MNDLSFDFNSEGLREFAQLVAMLQQFGVRFNVDRSGSRILLSITDK